MTSCATDLTCVSMVNGKLQLHVRVAAGLNVLQSEGVCVARLVDVHSHVESAVENELGVVEKVDLPAMSENACIVQVAPG